MVKRLTKREIADMEQANAFGFKAMQRVIALTEGPQPKLRVVGAKKRAKANR